MKIKYKFKSLPCDYIEIEKEDVIFSCPHVIYINENILECEESHVVYLETENGVPIVICQKCLENIELEDVRKNET